ncbi:MAG: hypothetical protein A2V66_16445 [Ignavibacteria bacterium RBG_13_36_8]|nr:MAG: hypothetical protein A2V66_16445 [Ignavibacteria bacterium RBG_13_36_8]
MQTNENVKTPVIVGIVKRVKDNQIFWIISFAILTFFAAQLAVPVKPVPFTLQTMLILLSGALLGARNGMFSQFIYLLSGAIGLPVFAGFSFGVAVFAGPTGGYLLSFPFAAFIVGYLIEKNNKLLTTILSMVLGNMIILLSGTAYLFLFFGGNFENALLSGALIFSVWDLIKITAAVSIYRALSKKYPKLPE